MIEFNEKENRLILKLVYYGPALSGKTTNLLRLHDILGKEGRGDLMMLDTKGDRTIYFDLLPFFLTAPSGLKVKLKVYTVPGQVCHDATRKAVLMRADGVAFIADSQRLQQTNNAESFMNLENNLAVVGIDIDRLPLVIQFNKRDLHDIISREDIEKVWSGTGIPFCMASALDGAGVIETFMLLAEITHAALDTRLGLTERHGLSAAVFRDMLSGGVREKT